MVDERETPWLRVHDLKQWRYCRRIVFFDHVMPVGRRATFKMEHGRAVEVDLSRLERRRQLREYGLDDGRRHFRVALRSPTLRLTGTVDLVIEASAGVYPVDFKYTEGPVRANHVTQVAAYALLLEEAFGRCVDRGFVYLVPQERIESLAVPEELKAALRRALVDIRAMVRGGACPDPTPVRARCGPCEYRNYCADVF